MGMDVPKQFLPIAGRPVLLHALEPFTAHPQVACTVVVLPEAEAAVPPQWLAPLCHDSLRLTAGGATRRASVAAGLAALPEKCSVVLVHDGARPFPAATAIDHCIAAARDGRAAVVAVPVVDTVKRADDFGRVHGTIDRVGLWHAQTPQGFPRELLAAAHAAADNAGLEATDDASLVERIGGRVELIPGDRSNLKITTVADLEYAEWLAGRRQ